MYCPLPTCLGFPQCLPVITVTIYVEEKLMLCVWLNIVTLYASYHARVNLLTPRTVTRTEKTVAQLVKTFSHLLWNGALQRHAYSLIESSPTCSIFKINFHIVVPAVPWSSK
jgi:hypothetical protein